jgi:lycopene cyclase domain-containing protein
MSLYFWLLILSIIIPLVLSFDKRVGFYKYWPLLLPSILVTGVVFITFDIYFASKGIWGFNPHYHSGILLAGVPLEEWLFFAVIPYSSIFIHYVLFAYFPETYLSDRHTRITSLVLISILFFGIITNYERAYTLVCFSLMIIVLLFSIFEKTRLMNRFYLSFLVILIPFMIINGILTGTFIQGEVVWYNPEEITGIRILTVPVEDFAYGFSLILINLLLMNYFRRIFNNVQRLEELK